MRLCLDVLSDRFGITRPTFAFPYGAVSAELVDAARQLEISCALTVRHRRVQAHDDLFQWGRFDVGPADTPAMIAAKLSGWYPALATTAKEVVRPLATISRAAARLMTAPPQETMKPDVALT